MKRLAPAQSPARHKDLFGVALLLLLLVAMGSVVRAAYHRGQTGKPTSPVAFIWLEGEKPSSQMLGGVKPLISGWGQKQFLSGDTWLQVSVDADKVEKETPADGMLLQYAFTVPSSGRFEVWNRIGYEFVRSPFAWRVDNGVWQTIGPDELTTDLMLLQDWNEVAWLKMGAQRLAAGAHKLDIRLLRTKDDKGKTARILYASDALCVTSGAFSPNGKFKPNETGRDAKDAEAAKKVFTLPTPSPPGGRSILPLNGLWEVCRNDEQKPGLVATPMTDFPATPHWKSIPVPGDRNTLRPDLEYAHRLWYRTRIQVPASYNGRSFQLTFPQNNLNTTVYVNGVLCGFNKNPFARFTIDVTKGVKPGINEVWVGIRDAWYGYSTNPKDPMKLRRKFNLPFNFAQNGFQDLAYPVWHAFQSGILQTPVLVASGSTYAADVFCKPSVARKELAVDVTLSNRGAKPASGQLVCQAVNVKTGAVEKTLPASPFTLPAGGEQTLSRADRWDNPRLWWPDDPQMYILRTTVQVGGKPVDISETPFGFREWTSDGPNFKLNGLIWHGWAELAEVQNKEEWLAWYRKTNQRTMRFWGTNWYDLSPDSALDWFDQNGIVVRRSGMLDGEAIGYNAIENDPDLKKLYGSEIKMDLMQNWRDQMLAQVKGERNHPSVMLWSIENEWLYINCINLFGHLMDSFEAEVTKTSKAVRQLDPTRLTMTDGGGANKDQSMPVHGNHYVFGDEAQGGYSAYPSLAYQQNAAGGGRGRWVWDQKRPRFLGEDYFATGINPFDYSIFGGEAPFQGKAQARPAAGLVSRMLTEGYRWAEFSAFHFWLGESAAKDYWLSNAPRAVFVRQWDWTFGSGQKVKRTLGIFNDSRFDDPLNLTWTLMIDGKSVASGASEHRVASGANEKFDITLPMPEVGARQEGEFVLSLTAKGQEVYRDVKAVSLLNTRPMARDQRGATLSASTLLVYDPAQTAAAYLRENGVTFTTVADLKQLPETGRVLVVGKDALTIGESSSSALAAWASSGRSVVVLEQKNPLKYQAMPAEMEPAFNDGRTAFIEDPDHPIFRSLKQKDFFTWGGGKDDEVVYRNAWLKPTLGGKSLLQCHNRLANTALAEVPAGQGVLLLNQLTLEEKLASNVVAQQLLMNLLEYAVNYKQEFRTVSAALADNSQLAKTLDATGVQYGRVDDPLKAISGPGGLAILSASPANLKTLAENKEAVDRFTESGGWILLNGLTPDGLADYNRLVGIDHMIRPFRQERITFPAVKNPLTAGLTTGDIVMQSGKRINDFTSDVYLASDVFSYVVDYDEVAPFAKFPDPSYFGYKDSGNDHNPLNMVNGFYSADGWQYIFSIWAGGGVPTHFALGLPKEQEITEFEWAGNAFYDPITKVELTFDGRKDDKITLDTKPNNEVQTFPISPSRRARDINIHLAEWLKTSNTPVIGVDNLRIKAKRSEEFYRTVRPLLNIGAMMEYVRGKGGLVLCNVLFQDTEAVPENLHKKRHILATILRNLKAPFSGGKTVIAGAKLEYQPIDISKQANQYRDERGWFGDKAFTFKDMPTGRQTLAGVPFQIYDFATSPVPTVIMLDGPNVPNRLPGEVKNIPIGRKADALFFLQTARMDARMNDQEKREKKRYEMLRYLIHYADGQTLTVPIYAEVDIDDYRQKSPGQAIPGAQIAWTRPYEGTEWAAVAYNKQWDNPRPDVSITSVDVAYGDQKRGVPVVIAITAATAKR